MTMIKQPIMRKSRLQTVKTAVCGLGLFSILLSSNSFANQPPLVSQVIRAAAPIYNQIGHILIGNEPAREDLGMNYMRGNMVEILSTSNGIIYPPQINGLPDPRNTRLHVTYIGYGIDPSIEYPGKFATMLSPRPPDGTKIFVRVFNMPSLELASFYSDSQIFTVSWSVDTVFSADIPHTSNPIDPDDDDGDGLNNSWERWNGSNPNLVDTDGDGFSDMEEFLAGTDADDWDSFLQIVGMTISNNNVVINYMAGKDRNVNFQRATNLVNYTQCSPLGDSTNCPLGFATVEVPVVSDSDVQVFRLGVPINEF